MYVFQKVPRLPPVFVYAIALGLSSFFIPAASRASLCTSNACLWSLENFGVTLNEDDELAPLFCSVAISSSVVGRLQLGHFWWKLLGYQEELLWHERPAAAGRDSENETRSTWPGEILPPNSAHFLDEIVPLEMLRFSIGHFALFTVMFRVFACT